MERENCIDTIMPSPPRRTFGLPPWTVTVVRALGTWIERDRQRRHLAELSDAALRDIGLTRADVRMELDKPFWRP